MKVLTINHPNQVNIQRAQIRLHRLLPPLGPIRLNQLALFRDPRIRKNNINPSLIHIYFLKRISLALP